MSLPGGWEILIIAVIAIIIFGGNKGMESMKKLGKGLIKAKKEIDDIKDITK